MDISGGRVIPMAFLLVTLGATGGLIGISTYKNKKEKREIEIEEPVKSNKYSIYKYETVKDSLNKTYRITNPTNPR